MARAPSRTPRKKKDGGDPGNNTNPVLRDDAPERAAVTAAGWEVAYDGLELEVG
jgi:hypothetical protein